MAGAWVVDDDILVGFMVVVLAEPPALCYIVPISDVIKDIKRRCKVNNIVLPGSEAAELLAGRR